MTVSIRKEIEIGGKPIIIETGKLAKQADGAVTVRYGDTVVLVTAVAAVTAPIPVRRKYRSRSSPSGSNT